MLGARYVEYLHDELLSKLWPEMDPVTSLRARRMDLLDSAVARPFHSAFGKDVYPTILDKGVALFHSLNSNHPFQDGNKRTAVIAVGHFFLANGHSMFLTQSEMYELAKATASYKSRGLSLDQSLRQIRDTLSPRLISIRGLKDISRASQVGQLLYTEAREAQRRIRRDERNRLIPSE